MREDNKMYLIFVIIAVIYLNITIILISLYTIFTPPADYQLCLSKSINLENNSVVCTKELEIKRI